MTEVAAVLPAVDWSVFRLEAVVLGAVLLGIVADLVRPRGRPSVSGWILLAGSLAAGAMWIRDLAGAAAPAAAGPDGVAATAAAVELWGGFYVVDPFAVFFKGVFLLALIVVVLASIEDLRGRNWAGEYFACLGASATGMMLLASANELVSLFVSLELVSVSLYVMAALKRGDTRSQEAGLKYVLVGAFSTALFLFGASFVYAVGGTTSLRDLAVQARIHPGDPLLLLGMILMLAALGFKIAAAPFHMWAPDVYEGGPTPMVAFASVASKGAGFAIVLRLLLGAFLPLQEDWTPLLMVMTAATLVTGSFLALPQTNIKRLLAYSSIAQAGYLLMGFLPGSDRGAAAVMLYLGIYVFTNLGAFITVMVVTRATGTEEIADYAGLARRSPLLALVMLLALLSLAGIPPLGGFIGKFYLFAAAMEYSHRFLWVVVLGVLLSIVSLFYYLMVIRQMYIEKSASTAAVSVGPLTTIALVICGLGIVLTGVVPRPLIDYAAEVAKALH